MGRQKNSTPSPSRTSVSMLTALHSKLKLIAVEESERRGARVGVADLVEWACGAVWLGKLAPRNSTWVVIQKQQVDLTPERAEPTEPPACPVCETPNFFGQCNGCGYNKATDEAALDADRMFADLLEAALAPAAPDVICALEGTLPGTFAPIERRDLAYHLRSALDAGRAITTLEELIVDYQG
jgi:hypothetical protein